MAKNKKIKTDPKNHVYIGSKAFDVFLIIFMLFLSIIFLYPFLHVVAVSLSSNRMIVSGQVTFYPKELFLGGYQMLFKEEDILLGYWNTIVVAILSTAFTLVLNSLLAYVMMIPDFVFQKPISIFLMITMFFGGGTVPMYILIRNLGLYDTWWAVILPGAVSAYNVFVYRAYFKGISLEIREAARIDGAGEFSILTMIYAPLSKALYATFGLFSVVGVWNGYFDFMLYIHDPKKRTIQLVLREIASNTSDMADTQQMISSGLMNQLNVKYAGVIATIAPILLIYPFLQKYFGQGMQVGAVKG